uniref:Uncharacterized protein n=1 Tax=uncultured prokaryote TaxID=198431 RepID=H5SPY9_9ZZZZ|nr:hypothetical protein HGMM_F55D02C25 [uncultured prokaryote]
MKEKLKGILREMREKYKKEWEKVEPLLLKEIPEKFRRKLEESGKPEENWLPALEEVKGELKKLEIPKFTGIWTPGEENKEDKEDLTKVFTTIYEDFKENPDLEYEKTLGKYAKGEKGKALPRGTSDWTMFWTLLNPNRYFYIHDRVLKRIGEELEKELGREFTFWGGGTTKNIEVGIEFLNTLWEIKEELGIASMLEVGYYLYRYNLEGEGGHPSETESKGRSLLLPIITAINTKPFLILAGISGTGKTQIARIIANVMSSFEKEEKAQPSTPNPPFDKGGEGGS